MDIEAAKGLTGMMCREFPDATTDFLRCQIGFPDTVLVFIGARKKSREAVFCLRAFGKNWDEAIDMLERIKKAV